MFEKFWEIIREKDNLLVRSKNEAITMLRSCKEMFQLAKKAIQQEVNSDIREDIQKADRKINKQQRDVRKMIFEHLSISSSGDLLTGLQLLNIVIDIERIGDYTKNIADLIDMLPKHFDFQEYEKDMNELEAYTVRAFDAMIKGLEQEDAKSAEEVTDEYDKIAGKCDKIVKELITSKTSDDMVEKRYLAILLLIRYLKRVNAHLKNIATTMVNPFHRIGYQPQ